ncbi:MAG: 4-amino-4-deoxy-L-arabinose transferase [Planctomycetes bacterium SCN 63-9]|nr:MAG: 4-amino-4-deoxy-L-arabinose transferase [Planctomycetes bacterium SCN 63-9]
MAEKTGERSPLSKRGRGRLDRLTTGRLALLLGGFAGLLVVLTLGGPGLTIDEPLDVRPGRNYLSLLRAHGWRFFSEEVVERTYRDNAEHPPLGRWLLGIASTLGEPFQAQLGDGDPTGLYVGAGRLAPAAAFALTVGLVVAVAGRRGGRAAGCAAGIALLLMPRVFAHAHLAALDTFIMFFWTLALVVGNRAISSRRPAWAGAGAGLFWGLALLTKIHAWLLPPPLGAWVLLRMGARRGGIFLISWTCAGLGLFWIGWPWLWFKTWSRLGDYLGTTGASRAVIHALYFGQVYADRDLPWHYPWFYFAVTVPIGLHLLGIVGTVRAWRGRKVDPFPLLLLGSIGLFLLLFSTRTPVYDGERLFLNVFPAWAILIGLGFGAIWGTWPRLSARGVLLAFLFVQGYGMVTLHPFGLSYYNALVGGLPGAERLGLELTYWNDPVDRVLLDRLAAEMAPKETASLAPTLYPGQGIMTTTAPLARRDVILQDQEGADRSEWVVVSRREAYWQPSLRKRIEVGDGRLVLTRSRQGVWLSAIWHFPVPPKIAKRTQFPGRLPKDVP